MGRASLDGALREFQDGHRRGRVRSKGRPADAARPLTPQAATPVPRIAAVRQRELSGSRSGLCPHGASDPRHRHPRAGRHRRPPALGLLRYLALDATPRRRPINSPHGSGTKRSLAGVQIKSKHAKEKPGAESGLRKEGKSGAPARGVGDGGRSSRAGVRELNARPRHRFQKFSDAHRKSKPRRPSARRGFLQALSGH